MQISGSLAKIFLFLFFSKCKEYFCGCACGNKRATPPFKNELAQRHLVVFIIKRRQGGSCGLFLWRQTPANMLSSDLHFSVSTVYPWSPTQVLLWFSSFGTFFLGSKTEKVIFPYYFFNSVLVYSCRWTLRLAYGLWNDLSCPFPRRSVGCTESNQIKFCEFLLSIRVFSQLLFLECFITPSVLTTVFSPDWRRICGVIFLK